MAAPQTIYREKTLTISQGLTEEERYILNTVRAMRFGALQVHVHNGKIMQVEKTEKMRFDQTSPNV